MLFFRGWVKTLLADFNFGTDGEWTSSNTMFYQVQGIKGSSLAEVDDVVHYPVVWPDELKSADLVYPYADALK